MPLSLSALKKLHSRRSNWYVYSTENITRKCEGDGIVKLQAVVLVKETFFPLTISSVLPQCNNNEIRPGKHIGVCISVANNRLFVGSIPKSKTKEQIVEEFAKVTGESTPSLDFFF